MKRWLPYREHLHTGDWQVHTTWSDGTSSIFDYCAEAKRRGLNLVAFTEHVRRTLQYDFWAYVREVEEARQHFTDLILLAGCEAKVLNTAGDLDAPPEVLEGCDLVLAAFHSFHPPEDYIEAVETMLCNPKVDGWAHPTLYAKKHGIALDDKQENRLVQLCIDHEVLIEFNSKHQVPSASLREKIIASRAPFIYGSDAHCVSELGRRD